MSKSKYKRLTKEGFWIVVGQIAMVAGSLALLRTLTVYMLPDQYGQLALGLSIAGLVNQFVMGGITAAIGRFYSIAIEKNDLSGYLSASLRIMGYATCVVLIISLILVVCLLGLGYSQWLSLALAAIVFSLLSGYNSSLSAIQNAARQRAIVAFHAGMDAWLKILLAVGMLIYFGTSSALVVISYACSSLITTVSQLFFLRSTILKQQIHRENRQQWLPQIWVYSLPFTTWGAFTWMQQISDRWALQVFATTNDVGHYAVLFQLGFIPISLITGMAVSFLAPVLYERSGDAEDLIRNSHVHQLSWKITNLSLILTLVGFVITLVLHEWIFCLLVAPEYWLSSYLLPWVVLAGGCFAAAQMLALKLMSEMKPSAMQVAKIVSALIGTMLNIVGAAIAGIQGVVGALVIFSCIYLVWMMFLAKQLPRKA